MLRHVCLALALAAALAVTGCSHNCCGKPAPVVSGAPPCCGAPAPVPVAPAPVPAGPVPAPVQAYAPPAPGCCNGR
jgi:hypothetical protein